MICIQLYTEQGKSSVLQDSVTCVLHTKCIIKEVVFVTFALLWFTEESSCEQYLSLKHFQTLSKHSVIIDLRGLILEL